MSLVLYYHPLSSFCWKVLIPLYENGTAFEPKLLQNLGDPAEAAAFRALWPVGKMPILVDEAHDRVIPETSVIVEWLDRHHRGATRFIPEDADLAHEVRLWDRIYDLYVQQPMQRIVFDRLRPPEQKYPTGVAEERELLKRTMAMIDAHVAGKQWATGEQFSLADCAAAPALFYADKVEPFDGRWPNALALLERLKARPSFARVLREAEPYFQYFPKE
jgi:glutathione S-transferase